MATLYIRTTVVAGFHGMFDDTCQAMPVTPSVKSAPSGHCVGTFEDSVTAHEAVLRHRVAHASKHERLAHPGLSHPAPRTRGRRAMCHGAGCHRAGGHGAACHERR